MTVKGSTEDRAGLCGKPDAQKKTFQWLVKLSDCFGGGGQSKRMDKSETQ